MSIQPRTDDVRDIWVDYHLNVLPRAKGIALVPEYQAAFDAWLETIRADEREQARRPPGTSAMTWRELFLAAEKERADLRAKVRALLNADTFGTSYDEAIGDVLDLLDGGSK